jgi:exonuclease III
VLHLQEARLRRQEVPKWRRYLRQLLPKYAMYAHCTAFGSKPTTAVVTLVRRELVKWISPMSAKSVHNTLSGRVLALKYAPPNVQQPIVLANVWMPHSGYRVQDITDAHAAFGTLVDQWKQDGYAVLAAGDWNATTCDEQRMCYPRGQARNPRSVRGRRIRRSGRCFKLQHFHHPTLAQRQLGSPVMGCSKRALTM